MTDHRGVSLSENVAGKWLASVCLAACVIDYDDGSAAMRRLPEAMAPLWNRAYGGVEPGCVGTAVPCPPIASHCERMLVNMCLGLATICTEDVLRAAVNESSAPNVGSTFTDAMHRSFELVNAKLVEALRQRSV